MLEGLSIRLVAAATVGLMLGVACPREARGDEHVHVHGPQAHHGHGDVEAVRPLGWSLRHGWRDCWVHTHASVCGTPKVHGFRTEPAFLGRELFLDVEGRSGEQAFTAEAEWALTRRIGLLAELPVAWGGADEGLGDVGVGLRLLLAETHRVLLAGTIEVEIPVGSRGLSADELVLVPSLSTWVDLGGWWTTQAQAGLEIGAESGDTSFLWGALLARSFQAPLLFSGSHHQGFAGHAAGRHGGGCEGLFTLLVEASGDIGLSGAADGSSTTELLFGAVYALSEVVDVRAGFTLTWDDAVDAQAGWIAGLVIRF